MFSTGSGSHLSRALLVSAVFMISPYVAADDRDHLPASNHQLENARAQQEADKPGTSAGSAGMPAPAHQRESSQGSHTGLGKNHHLILSGDQEVPPVTTAARGKASITIAADKTVVGGVTTTGMQATAAHIHLAAVGKNGPVVITLTKDGQHGWLVPVDCVLTDAQYASFKAGDLYINVHSAAHEAGEVRAQLMP